MTKKIKLGIIFGGKSLEHEVSLLSAASVIRATDKEKYEIIKIGITKEGKWLLSKSTPENIENGSWEKEALNNPKSNIAVLETNKSLKDYVDVVFPVLHGPYGEDGTIQGLFEMVNIPYVGGSVIGTSTSMDKIISKKIFNEENIPVCKYIVVMRKDILYDSRGILKTIEEKIQYPMFVKPANLGSSVGISKAHNKEELEEALKEAMKHDRKILIEEYINCREIEIAVIGNDEPKVSAVGEVIAGKEFYDYEAKYQSGGKSEICIPANISKDKIETIKELAVKAYKALDLCGCSRIDFFLDKDTDNIYINEINALPGFTSFSMFPLLFEEAGLEYKKLINELVEYAIKRHQEKN